MIQSIANLVALIAGGIWVLITVRRRRLRFPRAEITHSVMCWPITEEKWHIHVAVHIRNDGEVLLRLNNGWLCAQRIEPCAEDIVCQVKAGQDPVKDDSTEVDWPLIGTKRNFKPEHPHEIEPGESDELHFDVFGDAPLHRILIYSHFSNISKRRRLLFWKRPQIGWNNSTFYEFGTT